MDFFSSLLSGIGNLIGSIFNYNSQKENNSMNYRIHKEDQEFQAAQTQAAWERDDTAHQREVADLEAAGLSPLANTTGNPVTSPLGSASPIAMQAPQFDINSVINSMLKNKQLDEDKRHNMKIEEYRADELENQAKELKIKADQVEIENKKLGEEFRHNASLELLQAEAQNELVRHNKEEESLREREIALEEYNSKMRSLIEQMKRATGGKDIDVHFCDSETDLIEYNKERQKAYEELIANLGKYSKNASAQSHSESSSVSAGGGFGVKQGPDFSLNGTNSNGHSDSTYNSEDFGKTQEVLIDEFNRNFPPAMLDIDKSKRNLLKEYKYKRAS